VTTRAYIRRPVRFPVTDEILDQFKAYLKEKKYQYEHPIEKRLEELKQESVTGGYDTALLMDIDRLQKGSQGQGEMLDRSAEDIRKILTWKSHRNITVCKGDANRPGV